MNNINVFMIQVVRSVDDSTVIIIVFNIINMGQYLITGNSSVKTVTNSRVIYKPNKIRFFSKRLSKFYKSKISF